MKVLSLSGGATRFVGISGCAIELIKQGYKPDVIVGVSAGAIASVPIALGLYNQVIDKGLSITLKDIFKVVPINEKGRITIHGIIRLLLGYNSIGVQQVDKLLSELVSKDKFAEYVSGNYPTCYCSAVNMETGEKEWFNLKECDYNTFLKAVSASSHIPLASQAININNKLYYDGGLRDHNLGCSFVEEFNGVTELVSIYGRPQGLMANLSTWNKSLFSILDRTMDIMQNEISRSDEYLEKEYCQNNNIKLTQLFLPRILTTLYDTDINRLIQLYHESIKIAQTYK